MLSTGHRGPVSLREGGSEGVSEGGSEGEREGVREGGREGIREVCSLNPNSTTATTSPLQWHVKLMSLPTDYVTSQLLPQNVPRDPALHIHVLSWCVHVNLDHVYNAGHLT